MSVDNYLRKRAHATAKRVGVQISLAGMTTAEKWDEIDRLDAIARQQQMARFQAMGDPS